MVSYTEKKQELIHNVHKMLARTINHLPESPQIKALQELEEDLQQDYYTVVVVGEFKNGKSTFVNALLQECLMPVDVTPTTATINAVFYSEERSVEVVKTNGTIEKRELTPEVLNEYVASSDFNPNDIQYIKLFLPASMIKNRIVLVDTPGVNDLNTHRSDVTYQFIPRADAVLFMFDMTTPVKNTEKEFLQNTLLKQGLERILYVANFMDRVDEEEIDEIVELMERRLENITGQAVSVYPISAYEALEGKLQGNEELLQYSGMPQVEEGILQMLESGTRSEEKITRFQTRFQAILTSLNNEMETMKQLEMQSLEQLESQLSAIQNWLSQREHWISKLNHYIFEREEEIKYIVHKSIQFFGERLREDVANRIHLFHGGDVKPLVQSQLPIYIRSQFTQWIDRYSDSIQELFRKLEKNISKGLSDAFRQNVVLQSNYKGSLQFDTPIPMISAQSGNASVKAGLVVGGVSALAMMLGGTFFIPIVGMAGLPFLQQKIAEKQLENIRPELLAVTDQKLEVIVSDFQRQIDHYITNAVLQIKREALLLFENELARVMELVQHEVQYKRTEKGKVQLQYKLFEDFQKELVTQLYDYEKKER